jgi:death-on-curing protein
MAAAYLYHITQNHPFLDGNKRVGANAAITFLWMNEWQPTFDEDQLVDLCLGVASERIRKEEVISFMEQHCQPSG